MARWLVRSRKSIIPLLESSIPLHLIPASAGKYLITNFKKEKEKKTMRTTIIRTFNGTKASVKVVNVTEEKVETKDFTVPVAIEDNNKLMKALKKSYETDEIKLLSIVSTEPFEDVYEISIEDFLKYAKKVEPKDVAEKTKTAKAKDNQ